MIDRFGLSLPIIQQVPSATAAWERDAGGREILAIARAADRLGYRHLTCSDHVLVAKAYAPSMGATWYEPSATLGFVAGATERIGLLTHVIVLPYRHPLIVAKTYATLDRLSGGRVILGVGSGHAKPEFRTLGAEFEARGAVTDEAIRAIRAAWSEEVASFEGKHVRFRDVLVSPPPQRPGGPPIWVGGNGRPALRRAATLGEGWIPWKLAAPEFAAAVSSGERMRAEAGRSGPFERVAPLHVGLAADEASVAREVATWRKAGATFFHLGVEGRGLEEYLARIEWLAAALRGLG